MRIRGQTLEAWTEEYLVTCNQTSKGWLVKIYDLRSREWPCIATYYGLGEGTWLFDDSKADTKQSSDSGRRLRFGDRVR